MLVADEGHVAVHLFRVVPDGLEQAGDGGNGVGLGQRGGDDVGVLVIGVCRSQRVELIDAVGVLLLHQSVAGELPDDVLGSHQKRGVVGVGAIQRELHAAIHGQGVAPPAVGDGTLRIGGAVGLGGVVVPQISMSRPPVKRTLPACGIIHAVAEDAASSSSMNCWYAFA